MNKAILPLGIPLLVFSFAWVTPVQAENWSLTGDDIYNNNPGLVGVGTSSPAQELHVTGDAKVDGKFYGSSSNNLQLQGVAGYGITFFTNGSNERMRITSSGDVGIGTGSPSRLFHVAGQAQVDSGIYGPSTGSLDLQSQTGKALRLYTNGGTERLTITSGGFVGIRTTSPDQELHVDGNVKVEDKIYGSSTSDLNLQGLTDYGISFFTDGSNERMRITKPGRVLINETTIPSCTGSNKWECKNSQLYVVSTSTGDDEAAIKGIAKGTSSNAVGIWGITRTSGNSSGQPIGVRGDAMEAGVNLPPGGQFGVLGYNWATQQTEGIWSAGGWFGSVGTPGSEGEYSGFGHGVMGETYSTSDGAAGAFGVSRSDNGKNFGLFGSNKSVTDGAAAIKGHANANTGNTKGVWGLSESNTNTYDTYGVYSSGDLGTSGAKPAVVYTETQGPTQIYVIESPGIWFEDIGESNFVNGSALVTLDPLFLETITVNETHPMQVFITPYTEMVNPIFVERGTSSFTVREANGGTSNSPFGYRVMAKRKYYEDRRLKQAKVPIDQFMRPDLSREERDQLNIQWGLDPFYDMIPQ